MAEASKYNQGGDAQAIKRIANDYYGGYANMFEALGWPERGTKIMPSVQSRVFETYGSIRAFEQAHERGKGMLPIGAVESNPPNVWLTSRYGFDLERWGHLGFTNEAHRRRFIERSFPGVLVVEYGASRAARDLRGMIMGIVQCLHETGPGREFMDEAEWQRKESDPKHRGKWEFGVKIARAWRVTPEKRMAVRELAPEATASNAWQYIGAQGKRLTKSEALNILKLDLEEVEVYGRPPIAAAVASPAKEVLSASSAGPVSQSPYTTRESEGPKHLYVLKLSGNSSAFLGRDTDGCAIYKVGFSCSPETRCRTLNGSFPRGAFQWQVDRSTFEEQPVPYPSSAHAIAGEDAMKKHLEALARSLGGEFFLAHPHEINAAWTVGTNAANSYVDGSSR